MERRQKAFCELPEEVTTESGYCSERREELKAESRAARFISSRSRGGGFADIKENEDFRHFSYRLSEKVYKGFIFEIVYLLLGLLYINLFARVRI